MSGPTAPIRLLIVDDHPIVRDGLRGVLTTQPDFVVVGEAATGPLAIERACTLRPDVVLLDLELPELDGVAVLRRLRESCPAVRAIVFTAFDTDERIVEAVRAGAQGYLLKGVPREELFNAIRVVHGGGSLLQPIVASKLLRRVSGAGPAELSPRELTVLRLLAHGLPNKLIARDLAISERTVKFHVTAILAKLAATNRTEAVRLAAQQGLIELSDSPQSRRA